MLAIFSELRKRESVADLQAAPLTAVHGRGFYKSGERVKNSVYLAQVFEPVASMPSFGLVAHQLRQPQRAKYIARARYAPADGFRDLAGAQFFVFREQGNDSEGNRVAEKTAQPRLSIAHLFHGSDPYHVFAIAKTWQRSARGRTIAGQEVFATSVGYADRATGNLSDLGIEKPFPSNAHRLAPI